MEAGPAPEELRGEPGPARAPAAGGGGGEPAGTQRSISDRLFDIWDKKLSEFDEQYEETIQTVMHGSPKSSTAATAVLSSKAHVDLAKLDAFAAGVQGARPGAL